MSKHPKRTSSREVTASPSRQKSGKSGNPGVPRRGGLPIPPKSEHPLKFGNYFLQILSSVMHPARNVVNRRPCTHLGFITFLMCKIRKKIVPTTFFVIFDGFWAVRSVFRRQKRVFSCFWSFFGAADGPKTIRNHEKSGRNNFFPNFAHEECYEP